MQNTGCMMVVIIFFAIAIGDHDNGGIPDLMVKFDRQNVIDILEPGDEVVITVAGELIDGTRFEGMDYIKVI